MKKAEIKALLKKEFSNEWNMVYKSSSRVPNAFGQLKVGSCGPMDCTSAGSDRHTQNIRTFEAFLEQNNLKDTIKYYEIDRWSYDGIKGADYDRDYRTFFLILSWKE